jgi:hypothetical protein
MKKSKFGNLNFDSVETLSREELKKVKGGYSGTGDGTPWGFNVRYTLSCTCTGPNGDSVWTVSDVMEAGCSTNNAAYLTCKANVPPSVGCYNLSISGYTC